MQLGCTVSHEVCVEKIMIMPSYFFKCTKNGIIVTSNRITNKLQYWKGPEIVTFLDYPIGLDLEGRTTSEFISWIYLPEIKYGFFAVDDPCELEYELGDEIPVVITNSKCNQDYFPAYFNICWATPE